MADDDGWDLDAVKALAAPLAERIHPIVAAFHADNTGRTDFTEVYAAVTLALTNALGDSMVAMALCVDLAPEWVLGQVITGVSMDFCTKYAGAEPAEENTQH